MGLFDVVEPCAFLAADGRAVHHTRPGAVGVEIDDAEAAPMVEAGKLVPHTADTAVPESSSDIAEKPFPADVTPVAAPETPAPEDGDNDEQAEPHRRRGHRAQ